MASSADRNNPGIFGALFAAVLSLVLGCLFALLYLAVQPVEVLQTAPKDATEEGARQLLLGAAGSTAGVAWQTKRESIEGGTTSFTEAELNAWSEATFEPVQLAEDQKGTTVVILAGTPNFRIDGRELQVGLVNAFHFFGAEAAVVLYGRGEFAQGEGRWRFAPREAYLGALPLHRLPALLPLIASRFGASQLPAEVEKVLSSATEIALRDGALVITMP
jgi:hypothetical protein